MNSMPAEPSPELSVLILDDDAPAGHNQRPIDRQTGFEIDDSFERFDQRNEIYCRSEWDPEIQSDKATEFFRGHYMPHARARKADGFNQLDYALRNASWHVTNVLRDIRRKSDDRKEGFFDIFTALEEGWPEPYPFESPRAATENLRKVASFIGAGLLGICENDDRWIYTGRYSEQTRQSKPIDIPEDIPNIIVIGEPMDLDLTMTVPSALSGTATGMGYTHDTVTLLALTQYIKNLGYRAFASMNDSALAIPLAVQAGLGEVGRHSLLITPEFGPRLRLGKIFTDMPLVLDRPKNFGVREFCDICQRCSNACPPKAIPAEPPSKKAHSISNLKGVTKWTTHAEKCFKFWAAQNSDCSICIRVCPYNRDFSKWHNRLWRRMAGTRLRHMMLWIDLRFSSRERSSARLWWKR
jgi:reductive dehalogenase